MSTARRLRVLMAWFVDGFKVRVDVPADLLPS